VKPTPAALDPPLQDRGGSEFILLPEFHSVPSVTASAHAEAPPKAQRKKREPYRTSVRLDTAQEISRLFTAGHRLEHCNLDAAPGVNVEVMRQEDRSVTFSGYRPCGSPHCPNCAPILALRRRTETEEIVRAAFAEGFHVSFLTLTTRHNHGERLHVLLDALDTAWKRCNQGRNAKEWKIALGHPLGYVRAFEVTHGASGWHPHYHLLVIHAEPLDPDAVFDLYSEASKRHGRSISPEGFHVRPVKNTDADIRTISAYSTPGTAKQKREKSTWDAASEVTGGPLKDAHGRTLNDILDDATEHGDADDARLYAEYLNATKGRNVWRTSRHLRAKLGLEVEKTDEEIMEEIEKRGTPIMQLTRAQAVALAVTSSRGAFLRIVQTRGVSAGRDFLTKAVGLAFGRRRRPHAA